MKIIKYSLICSILLAGFVSCEKDGFTPLQDNRPAIPITVANATVLRFGPAVQVSQATDDFSIVLEIPTSSGRTIKEITKVITGSGPGGLFTTATSYQPVPIVGDNTNKITFNTSLTEWDSKPNNNFPAYPAGIPAVDLPTFFYFLLTLDDNSQIVSQQVRVLMVP